MKIRWAITATMFLVMIYAVFSQSELYPFAPYTMYSANYRPQYFKDVKIFFGKNHETLTEVTPQNQRIISPFDEARIKMSFENEKYRSGGLDSPAVRQKAKELLKTINHNSGEKYNVISVGIYEYKNLSDLRAGKRTLVEQVNETVE